MSGIVKFDDGKLKVSYIAEFIKDKDEDGKSSVKAKNISEIELDVVELIGEIAKKDFSFLESIINKIKLEKEI